MTASTRRPTRPPIVGVTATVTRVNDGGPAPIDAAVVDAAYLDALRAAGMLPVLLPPSDPAQADAALDAVDALLLSGGEDIDPAHYGETPHAAAGPFAERRDRWEVALARAAQRRRVPTLAICRGAQLLNVALGGTLAQHLGDDAACGARHDRMADRRARVHPITVAPASALARVLDATSLDVNSYHHQAIARVAPPLTAAAWCDDGVVEAVESHDPAWPALGVQWHPEDLVRDAEPWERRIFDWLRQRVTRDG
ncbi:peptidase C26 [Gemmatirosa kalamazoonensis]|uniref:Peptidase C26 n=1 Tax=Gemmatirosa kalamazoonensis TaxID=861299 RepID=W0RDX5_9BACT|nr:gamma-glutamyl-gamma-aminobutyrate hydrolase family protein [Gemmatirosa kalamazoonensis]AHG88530.1 peptidase C26 [Gemmatirosa kalamazoonensis]